MRFRRRKANTTTAAVLAEVAGERQRQDDKWGVQNYPWNASPRAGAPAPFAWLIQESRWPNQDAVKLFVDTEAERGHLGFAEILFEEVAEALDELDLAKVREELIQVAAVAVGAVESLDRNGR